MRIRPIVSAFVLTIAMTLVPIANGAAAQTAMIAQAMQTQPSPDEVKAAVKKALASVDLTMPQKREIRGMVQNYESQTANADSATKKTAQKTLMKNIYGVLTPTQQTQFKASMKESLGATP